MAAAAAAPMGRATRGRPAEGGAPGPPPAPEGRRGRAGAAVAADRPASGRPRGAPAPGATKLSAYQERVKQAEEAAAAGARAPLPAHKKRKRWTDDEDAALLHGVETYGVGQWKLMWDRSGGLGGPLADRGQVDLKDRYRNIQRKAEREAAGVA